MSARRGTLQSASSRSLDERPAEAGRVVSHRVVVTDLALPATPPPAATGAPTATPLPPLPPVPLPAEVSRLLPSTGFLRSYVEDAYPLSEASAEAHLIAALVTASALVGKKVRIAPWVGSSSLYLVIWAVLVGRSTLARKSTTVGLAENIIREIEAGLRLPDDTTAAALIDLLDAQAERVWFLSEFSGLIEQCKALYNVGMAKQLANLYDVPPVWEVARKSNREIVRVSHPYVALFGATTIAWLTEHLKETDLLGGLYARFLYVPIPDIGADGRLFSIPPAADETRHARAVAHARRLYAYRGTINLDQIRAPYDRWYRAHRRELAGLVEDQERLGGFWGRLETSALKIAALHQLSLATSDDGTPPADHVFVLEPEALDAAIALVDFLKTSLVRFMRQELAPNRVERLQQKLLGLVRTAGGRLKKRELQRKAGLTASVFHELMRGLTDDARFVVETPTTESGQTEVWVRLVEEADA